MTSLRAYLRQARAVFIGKSREDENKSATCHHQLDPVPWPVDRASRRCVAQYRPGAVGATAEQAT